MVLALKFTVFIPIWGNVGRFVAEKGLQVASWFIRPIEILDRRLAGLDRSHRNPSLAMHVGLQRVDARRRNLQCVGLMSTSPHIIFQEKIQNPFD